MCHDFRSSVFARSANQKNLFSPFFEPIRTKRSSALLPAQFSFHSNDTKANQTDFKYIYLLEINEFNRKTKQYEILHFRTATGYVTLKSHYGIAQVFIILRAYRAEFNVVPSGEYRDENLILYIVKKEKKKHDRFRF